VQKRRAGTDASSVNCGGGGSRFCGLTGQEATEQKGRIGRQDLVVGGSSFRAKNERAAAKKGLDGA